jgi:hypothetical protein
MLGLGIWPTPVNEKLERHGLFIGLLIGIGLLLAGLFVMESGGAAQLFVLVAGTVFCLLAVAPGAIARLKVGSIELLTREVIREVAKDQPDRGSIADAVEETMTGDPPRTIRDAVRVIATVTGAPRIRPGESAVETATVDVVLGADTVQVELLIESDGVAMSPDSPPLVSFTRPMGREGIQLGYRQTEESRRRLRVELIGKPVNGSAMRIAGLRLDVRPDVSPGPIRAHVEVIDVVGQRRASRLAPLGIVVADRSWAERELPILKATYELTTSQGGPSWDQVAAAVGLPQMETQMALRRLLDAGYLKGIDVTTFGSAGIELIDLRLLAPGLRALGVLPADG